MSMRNKLRLLFPFFLLAFITSCSGNSSNNAVTFMVFGDPAERDAYLNLVAEFEARHPEINVELTHIPSPRDYRTRLATEYAAGSPPDVSLMNYRRYGSFAASGLLEPLGDRLENSNLIQPEDFYPITLEPFHWQGELMCIPQNISSLVVYYNQDLFDDEGLPYPSDSWTWDEFLETAVTLTKDLDGNGRVDQYGLGTDTSFFRLIPFVWQNEAPIVDDPNFPKRLTLTRPPSLAAFEWFVELQTVHGVMPDRLAEASQDSESRFIAGTVGMFLNSRRGTPSYREIKSFTWDVAPYLKVRPLPVFYTATPIAFPPPAKTKRRPGPLLSLPIHQKGNPSSSNRAALCPPYARWLNLIYSLTPVKHQLAVKYGSTPYPHCAQCL